MPISNCLTAHEEVSDETLMALYVDGVPAGFEQLFLRYEGRAYAYFLKRTHSRERTQDLYQDLFLRIHRARDSYDPARAFAPWFFQIARRLWIDDQRRPYRSFEVSIGEHEPIAANTCDAGDRQELAQILGALSPDERYVLVAAKAEGIAYSQLAAELEKSVDAIKQMASRAMRRIRAANHAVACSAQSAR